MKCTQLASILIFVLLTQGYALNAAQRKPTSPETSSESRNILTMLAERGQETREKSYLEKKRAKLGDLSQQVARGMPFFKKEEQRKEYEKTKYQEALSAKDLQIPKDSLDNLGEKELRLRRKILKQFGEQEHSAYLTNFQKLEDTKDQALRNVQNALSTENIKEQLDAIKDRKTLEDIALALKLDTKDLTIEQLRSKILEKLTDKVTKDKLTQDILNKNIVSEAYFRKYYEEKFKGKEASRKKIFELMTLGLFTLGGLLMIILDAQDKQEKEQALASNIRNLQNINLTLFDNVAFESIHEDNTHMLGEQASSIHPFAQRASELEYFGRPLTSEELARLSVILHQQNRLIIQLSHLEQLQKTKSPAYLDTLKEFTLSQQQMYLEELSIRYHPHVEESERPGIGLKRLERAKKLLQNKQTELTLLLEEQENSINKSSLKNINVEITYLQLRIDLEREMIAVYQQAFTDYFNNAEYVMDEETQQEQIALLIEEAKERIIEERIITRDNLEPYEISRDRTIPVLLGLIPPYEERQQQKNEIQEQENEEDDLSSQMIPLTTGEKKQ